MLDPARLIHLGMFAAGGAAVGAAAWLISALASPNTASELLRRAEAMEAPPAPARRQASTADLLSMPLFAEVVAGPVEASHPVQILGQFRLHGISVTPRRRAALLSVGGGPAQWLAEGTEVGGVIVRQVRRDAVVMAIGGAEQTLELHSTAQAAAPANDAPVGLPPAPVEVPVDAPSSEGSPSN